MASSVENLKPGMPHNFIWSILHIFALLLHMVAPSSCLLEMSDLGDWTVLLENIAIRSKI